MATIYEIPLTPGNQSFAVDLAGTTYGMKLVWRAAKDAGWVLDISNSSGTVLVAGIPLLPGMDLLGQHRHLEIGGGGTLYVATDGDASAPPTFDNLGQASRLYWVPEE